jgi:hypothetical protein
LFFWISAEKEQLAREHRKALDAQEKISAELKDKLVQAELQHTRELKDVEAAGEAKFDAALKDFHDASGQLQKELEEETRLLKDAEDRNATLAADQAQFIRMIIQADELALRKFFFFFFAPSLISLYLPAMCPYTELFLGLFPDSQPQAHKRVMELRAEQASGNPDSPWSPYEHFVALHVRISHMRAVDRHLVDLPEVAMQIFKVMWLGEEVPANLTLLAQRLRDAGERFSEWKHSSARAGADAALRVVCSWYEELDLDALHSLRGKAPTDTEPALTAKARIACTGSLSLPAPASSFLLRLTPRTKYPRTRKKMVPATTRIMLLKRVMLLQSKLRKRLKLARSPLLPEFSHCLRATLACLNKKHCRKIRPRYAGVVAVR